MIELDLPPQTLTQLQRYVESTPLSAGTVRTSHWAMYGARNRISFLPARSRIGFDGGAGFDGFYPLNFGPGKLFEWARQQWTLWNTRQARRLFNRAFLATSAGGTLDLDGVTGQLGKPLTPHKALAAYYFNLIQPHLPAQPELNYLEIGAGSGYLAALLHKTRNCKTVIIDLPEIIPFSFLYMNRLFPQAVFQLPNEARDANAISRTADFVFLTPDQCSLLPDCSIDLAINTASFGEMLPQQIAVYFGLLRRVMNKEGLFFTCNRVEKQMQNYEPESTAAESEAPMVIRFADYPWKTSDTDLLFGPSKFHKVIQPENPMLQRLCHLAPP